MMPEQKQIDDAMLVDAGATRPADYELTNVADFTTTEPPPSAVETCVTDGAKNPPGRHCENRQNEWIMTYAILAAAFVMLISPNALTKSRFWLMTYWGVPQSFYILLFVSVGVLGWLALRWNGDWCYGAKVRMVCAFVRAVIWSQLAFALLWGAEAFDTLSIMIGVLCALAYGEAKSGMRALIDDEGPR
jgi:hypothetical protein